MQTHENFDKNRMTYLVCVEYDTIFFTEDCASQGHSDSTLYIKK